MHPPVAKEVKQRRSKVQVSNIDDDTHESIDILPEALRRERIVSLPICENDALSIEEAPQRDSVL